MYNRKDDLATLAWPNFYAVLQEYYKIVEFYIRAYAELAY